MGGNEFEFENQTLDKCRNLLTTVATIRYSFILWSYVSFNFISTLLFSFLLWDVLRISITLPFF